MSATREEKALALNAKFPCPGQFRGAVIDYKLNKLCGQRHKKNVAIYECERFARECSIEPYASGQPELCCKRCDVFWQTDKLKAHQLGVALPSQPSIGLRTCKCGRKFEGPKEWVGCGKTRCMNPDPPPT